MTLIDELVAELSPPEEIIRVDLAGRSLSFRAISDRAELRRLQRGAVRFSEVTQDKVLRAEDRPLYDTDAETKALAFVLAETSLEPKLKPIELLKLAKHAALGFEQLKDAVNRGHRKALETTEAAAIASAKNASGGTSSGDCA